MKSTGINAHFAVPNFFVNGWISGNPAHVKPRLWLASMSLQRSTLSLATVGGRYGIVLVVVAEVVVVEVVTAV
jgi:hypothetical protein